MCYSIDACGRIRDGLLARRSKGFFCLPKLSIEVVIRFHHEDEREGLHAGRRSLFLVPGTRNYPP